VARKHSRKAQESDGGAEACDGLCFWIDDITVHVYKMCVCVDHLKRCKTSTFRDLNFVWNFNIYKTMQGAQV